MAVPALCNITSPANGISIGAPLSGTASISVVVATDPTTPVSLKKNAGAYGAPTTSSAGGAVTFTSQTFTAGANTVRARAGTDPDFLESSIITFTVVDQKAAVVKASDRSSRWYLNFIAGNAVYGIPDILLPTMRSAACLWAGVSEVNFGTVAALNIKAGITDPGLYVSVNKALNLIAYATLNPDVCKPWLTNQGALFKIMNT